MNTTAKVAKDKVERGADEVAHSTWVEWLARIGYVARGVLYIVVGILAVQVALGVGGGNDRQKGRYRRDRLPAVWQSTAGVGGYRACRVRALGPGARSARPPQAWHRPQGHCQRIGYVVSALAYASLLFPTIAFIRGGAAAELRKARRT